MMTDESNNGRSWTDEERAGIKKLVRMAGILFLAIAMAGVIAAVISSALGTL